MELKLKTLKVRVYDDDQFGGRSELVKQWLAKSQAQKRFPYHSLHKEGRDKALSFFKPFSEQTVSTKR